MTGRGDVVFSWVLDEADAEQAYRWHASFAKGNPYILPRSADDYRKLIDGGQVLSAKDSIEILGLTYYKHAPEVRAWELGGLMVARAAENRGIGSTLARVALGSLLFNEQPYSQGDKVVAHVHAENHEPRRLLTDVLKFRPGKPVQVPEVKVPGLKHVNGIVHGLEFELDADAAQAALAEWCESWHGKLRDQSSARIEMGPAVTLQHWATAFRASTRAKKSSLLSGWLKQLLG